MKKFLKIMLLIILIIFIIIIIHTLRNLIIINNLKNRIKPYSESTNYSVHSVNISNNTNSKMDIMTYKKNEKFVRIYKRISNEVVATVSEYYDGKTTTRYTDSSSGKVVSTNENTMMPNITSSFELENTLLLSFLYKIRSTEYNGKDCYVVNYFIGETDSIYIEKDTGLCIKSISSDMVNEMEYKFDNVDDSIFIEPDASKYLTEEKAMEKYLLKKDI